MALWQLWCLIFRLNVVIKMFLFWKIQHTFIDLQNDCQLRLVHNFPMTLHRTSSLEDGWMDGVCGVPYKYITKC